LKLRLPPYVLGMNLGAGVIGPHNNARYIWGNQFVLLVM
jgi:hypothetical protein